MSDRTSRSKDSGESEVKTSILIQNYVFKWILENFQDWPKIFKVTSNEFHPATDIILYATFERFSDNSSLLNIISKGNDSFEIEYQFSILGSGGKVLHAEKPIKFLCDKNRTSNCIISPEIIKQLSESTEDKIVIFKFIMKSERFATENVNKHKLRSSTDPLPTLVEDFKAMYVNSICTDFSLVQSENSVLRVHKFVLCARSPVFAKMLQSPMDEKEKDAIEIPDIDLPTLKTFTEFLYTGNRPSADDVDFDSWCRLYYAADKYDVSSLRETCADTLLEKLDAENSCRALSLASRHSDVQLMDVVLDFMQCNFDAVLETEAWFELATSEPELTNRVMRLRVQKSKESISN